MPEKEKKVENEWFDAIGALYLNKKKTILEFGFMTYQTKKPLINIKEYRTLYKLNLSTSSIFNNTMIFVEI